jgi:GT2 family glycosyltransferase
MTITVLIPTWRRPVDLARCLTGLKAQTRPPDEVLVVIRNDDTDTRTLLAETEPKGFDLRRVMVTVPGVVAALNAGLDVAQSDIIVVTDDDTVPRPDWLSRIELHFQTHDEIGGVGGRDWMHHGSEVDRGAASAVGQVRWYGRVIGNHHLGVGGPREVDVLKGANMSFRRAAIQDVGFDERLRGAAVQLHYEIALGLALKRAGWRLIYDPSVAVDHYLGQRLDGEQRVSPSLRFLQDNVHNQTYALLRWLPWWRKPFAFIYGLAIGARNAPGIMLAVERWFREPDHGALRDRVKVSFRGRVEGLRTYLHSIAGLDVR